MTYSPYLARAVLGNLHSQQRLNNLCDLIVYVQTTEFRCHRLILCACSKYFSEELRNPESNSVALTNVSAGTFRQILECIYGGEDVLTEGNASELWIAAHLLKIDFLFEACEQYKLARLSIENCVEIFNLAKRLGSSTTKDAAWAELIANFHEIYSRGDFVKLDFEDMLQLMNEEDLAVTSEDVVVISALKWMNYTPEIADNESDDGRINEPRSSWLVSNRENSSQENDRKNFVLELLSSCRLFVVSGNCIQKLANTKYVIKNKKAFTLVREALKYHLQPERRGFYCPPLAVHRSHSPLRNVLVGVYRHTNGHPVFVCRASDGTWYRLCDKSLGDCMAAYGANLYLVTSKPRQRVDGLSVRKFNALNGVVTDMPSLKSVAGRCVLICLDHYIYAVEVGFSGAVHRCNILEGGQGEWEKFGSLAVNVQNVALMMCGSAILIFGNEASTQEVTVQSFDTLTKICSVFTKKLPSASSFVTFLLAGHTHVLLSNGEVWKLRTNNSKLEMVNKGKLFEGERQLRSAVTFNEELFLSVNPAPNEWNLNCIDRVSSVGVAERPVSCLLNSVIPGNLLAKKDN